MLMPPKEMINKMLIEILTTKRQTRPIIERRKKMKRSEI
jgi:hypothetical protein